MKRALVLTAILGQIVPGLNDYQVALERAGGRLTRELKRHNKPPWTVLPGVA